MKDSIRHKLDNLKDRFGELEALLSDAEVISDQNRFRDLSKEYAELEELVQTFDRYVGAEGDLEQAREMQKDSDPEIKEMAAEEVADSETLIAELDLALQTLLLPKDEKDSCNVFLEVRAGTGGDEAAIFSGDLFRMYSRYSELQGWRMEMITERHGEHGGYKELVVRIEGKNVYERLKFESGAHRVQRVPETETQGRIHTSACTVAIMPEMEGIEEIEINKADLRVDTFRASGAGGQHVNKTDSAVRLTHIPSGIVVECQDGRSQHKNYDKALKVLRSRIYEIELQKKLEEDAKHRKTMVSSGDRSAKIRTYNYPQGRVTEHRIGLTKYNLQNVIGGDIQEFIDELQLAENAEKLKVGTTSSDE